MSRFFAPRPILVALLVMLAGAGCDSNPGGPTAPDRPDAPGRPPADRKGDARINSVKTFD